MTRGHAAQPVAVAQFGRRCGSGVARAALRRNWTILNANEPGLARKAMSMGVAVLVVQLGEAPGPALEMVQRLSMHWNPVRCIVVAPVETALATQELELLARQAGAAAYVQPGAAAEHIESLTGSFGGSVGTAIAK